MLTPLPALSLLHVLLQELLGHCLPPPHIPCLCGCVIEFSTNGGSAQDKRRRYIAMGILSLLSVVSRSTLPYISISLSLNVLLTLMIVVRLVLHGRNVRAATGSPGGVSGLYKTIATMLIESSALFAVSSLLVIGVMAVDSPVTNTFSPALAETQVRAPSRLRSLDKLRFVTMDWTGDRFSAHHSTSRQQERIDRRSGRLRKHQFVQS